MQYSPVWQFPHLGKIDQQCVSERIGFPALDSCRPRCSNQLSVVVPTRKRQLGTSLQFATGIAVVEDRVLGEFGKKKVQHAMHTSQSVFICSSRDSRTWHASSPCPEMGMSPCVY